MSVTAYSHTSVVQLCVRNNLQFHVGDAVMSVTICNHTSTATRWYRGSVSVTEYSHTLVQRLCVSYGEQSHVGTAAVSVTEYSHTFFFSIVFTAAVRQLRSTATRWYSARTQPDLFPEAVLHWGPPREQRELPELPTALSVFVRAENRQVDGHSGLEVAQSQQQHLLQQFLQSLQEQNRVSTHTFLHRSE